MVLKNITRLQQQQEQCKNDSSNHYQVSKNGIPTRDIGGIGCSKNLVNFSLLLLLFFIGNYDEKLLMATRVLRNKLTTRQTRMPNATWSGLWFSSHMPESSIRKQLKYHVVRIFIYRNVGIDICFKWPKLSPADLFMKIVYFTTV